MSGSRDPTTRYGRDHGNSQRANFISKLSYWEFWKFPNKQLGTERFNFGYIGESVDFHLYRLLPELIATYGEFKERNIDIELDNYPIVDFQTKTEYYLTQGSVFGDSLASNSDGVIFGYLSNDFDYRALYIDKYGPAAFYLERFPGVLVTLTAIDFWKKNYEEARKKMEMEKSIYRPRFLFDPKAQMRLGDRDVENYSVSHETRHTYNIKKGFLILNYFSPLRNYSKVL